MSNALSERSESKGLRSWRLVSRVRMRNEGRGGRYTANRSPVHVVYSESYESSEAAITRERQLKRWTTQKKQALIAGDLADLKALSRRHEK